ncbi:MAG TPA: hypothetical protein VGK18_16215, partial [Propionicimonas sp.]
MPQESPASPWPWPRRGPPSAQSGCSQTGDRTPNIARYTFLDDGARSFYPDWDSAADVTVALLR